MSVGWRAIPGRTGAESRCCGGFQSGRRGHPNTHEHSKIPLNNPTINVNIPLKKVSALFVSSCCPKTTVEISLAHSVILARLPGGLGLVCQQARGGSGLSHVFHDERCFASTPPASLVVGGSRPSRSSFSERFDRRVTRPARSTTTPSNEVVCPLGPF